MAALVAGVGLAVASTGCAATEVAGPGDGAGTTTTVGDAEIPAASGTEVARRTAVLFTRTEGFRHDSIAVAAPALTAELAELGFQVTTTEDPGTFTAEALAAVDVVVFLETTGDVLDPPQEAALQQFVEGGGGWVGVHSALDTEYDWPFYETLAGASFLAHPAVQPATVRREDPDHPAMAGVPDAWSRTDEWYDLRGNPRPDVHVLATVDEGTYDGGQMGADHPIAWCRAVGAGQSFVTAMGHTDESWRERLFVDHVVAGIVSVTEPGHCG